MLWTVMFEFCFSKVATSSFHSLYCAGEEDGGAQSTLIETGPVAALPELLGLLLELEHAVVTRPRAATMVIAATSRVLLFRGLRGCRGCRGFLGWSRPRIEPSPSMRRKISIAQHTFRHMLPQDLYKNSQRRNFVTMVV